MMAEHQFIYRHEFSPDKYERYIRIQFDPENPSESEDWTQ